MRDTGEAAAGPPSAAADSGPRDRSPELPRAVEESTRKRRFEAVVGDKGTTIVSLHRHLSPPESVELGEPIWCPVCLRRITAGDVACPHCGALWGLAASGAEDAEDTDRSAASRAESPRRHEDTDGGSGPPQKREDTRKCAQTAQDPSLQPQVSDPTPSPRPPLPDEAVAELIQPEDDEDDARDDQNARPRAAGPSVSGAQAGASHRREALRRAYAAHWGRQKGLFAGFFTRAVALLVDWLMLAVILTPLLQQVINWRQLNPRQPSLDFTGTTFQDAIAFNDTQWRWITDHFIEIKCWQLGFLALGALAAAAATERFGVTLGKWLMGIVAVRDRGYQPLRFSSAWVRHVVVYWQVGVFCDFNMMMGALAGLPFLVAVFHPRSQGIHDLICKTVVIPRPADWSARLAAKRAEAAP